MTGQPQLDHISEAIGDLRGSSRALERTFTQHCDDDDRRHRENLEVQEKTNRNIEKLTRAVDNLTAAVALMQPVVATYQASRIKFGALMSAAVVVLGFVAWIAEQFVAALFKWLLPTH